ncbi:MAG TPA: hypothetical protein VN682_01770 [Terriglobales bacterium]|nr:hypothetical protein [Terriglobales bacterium]HXF12456.1 hypothetical protein [Terriglobales bacterium]
MRYARGSFVITADGDIPLLRQVRNCRFVSHQQLFELLQYDALVSCRGTFNWRIQRLLKTGHIHRLEAICWQGSPVYTITQNGLVELESQGEFAIALHSRTRHMPDRTQVFHALELCAIRLSLARNALLISWQSEIEISSSNMISRAPYQKDYDAIVKIWVGDEVREFALEYERSLKNAKQYEKVRAALEAERRIGCVLYLTTDSNLMFALLYQLTPVSTRLGFATSRSFREQLLATSVSTEPNRAILTLEEFLRYAHPLYMAS